MTTTNIVKRTTSLPLDNKNDKPIVEITNNTVSLGNNISMAIGSDGLYAWGRNQYGQLEIGNTTNKYSPVKVNLP